MINAAEAPDALLKKTRNRDMIRACCTEPIGAAFRGSGLGLIVALQFFDAQDWQKALLAAAAFIGLMTGPLVVLLIARLGIRVNHAITGLLMAAAPGFLLAALAQSLTGFMTGLLIAIPLLASASPLFTALWEQNAPPHLRGRVFSNVILVATVFALAGSLVISYVMRDDIERYRPILLVFAFLALVAGASMWSIPSQPIPRSRHHVHPLSSMSLMWEDRIFGYLCLAQMLLGIGNLATIPLRVEYLGSATRGMGLSAGLVLLITIALPEFGRLLSTPIWGRLFDRTPFVILRLSINLVFAASILLFFVPELSCVVAGSLLFGIATGGGKIAWSLWVTKYAPPDKTADYMGVHTFLTGVRGVASPQLSYAALAVLTIQQVGWIGAGLVVVSCVLLVFVLPGRSRD